MTNRQALSTDLAPAPLSTFSAGVKTGGIIQVSGQAALNPDTGEVLHLDSVAKQTVAALDCVRDILRSGGADFNDLVMLRVYLTTRDHFGPMNEAYAKYLKEHLDSDVPPTRTTVIVGLPLEGMLVEIDGFAVKE